LLVAASVQGYDFDSAVLAKVLALDAAEVEEHLERLERVHAFVRLVREHEFPDRTLTLRRVGKKQRPASEGGQGDSE